MSDGLPELRQRLREARHQVVQAEYAVMAAQNALWAGEYDAYLERLARFNAEDHDPVDSTEWWQLVRPLCQDCRIPISDPSRHNILVRSNEPPVLCCCTGSH